MTKNIEAILLVVDWVDNNNQIIRSYKGEYEKSLCIGEVVRNCCVNMGIDPDTQDGVTENVIVRHFVNDEWSVFRYNPSHKLSTEAINCTIRWQFSLLYK